MRFLGMVFVVLSASSVGFQIAANLKKRCVVLQQLMISLRVLKNEISLCGTQLPQAFALMAASVQEPLASLYSAVAKDMECNRWVTPYDAVRTAMIRFPETSVGDILLPLTKTLGKYDLEAQVGGIEKAVVDTEMVLQTLENERCLKSRTYRTLGICTGLAVAILLA